MAEDRRVRLRPTADGKGLICPVCGKPCGPGYLLGTHLGDHAFGRFGASKTGPIRLEITAVIEEASSHARR
jgi:hypothetical protein